MDEKEIVEVVEKAFGCPIGEVFRSFQTKPIASATIGQVERERERERE